MALIKTVLETRAGGEVWYDIHSNVGDGKVLQVETDKIYSAVAVTDSDPYTYEEYFDDEYE